MKSATALLWLSGALACSGQWYFEAGPYGRGDMEISVRGGSRAADAGLLAARPGTSGARAMPAGSLLDDDGSAQILRVFDDGYVGPSGWPWAQTLGYTQFYGYDNAAQYDAGADTLSFARTLQAEGAAERTITRVDSGPAGWSGQRRVCGAGVQATLGRVLHDGEVWDWSGQLQIAWLDGIDARFNGREAFRQDVEQTRRRSSFVQEEVYEYRYDTLGNPAFPAAPYEMLDPAGVGPLIADRPDSIEALSSDTRLSDQVLGRTRRSAASAVDLRAEASALVFNLGPRFRWHPVSSLSLLVQPGITLNVLDAEVSRREVFAMENGAVLGAWTDRRDSQRWLWGAGVAAGAQWECSERFFVHAAAGYEWVESTGIGIGPDRVRIDLSGYRVEAAIGIRFGAGGDL